MNVGFYATRIQALVMRERDDIEAAYERFPEVPIFWGMIDLVNSSNYRIVHGPRGGYIRGETFFSLVQNVVERCTEVRVLKELGDAVLIVSSVFRPMFEAIVLVDQVSRQMAAIAGTNRFPFAVRGGISFGPAKRLTRRHEDYLGKSIDQLSRIMSIRSSCNLHLHEEAYRIAHDQIAEYGTFAHVSDQRMLGNEQSKNMEEPIYYREVTINPQTLVEFRDHFVFWRQ